MSRPVPTVPDFSRKCDKCGEPVEQANDAVTLEAMVEPFAASMYRGCRPRHLLPTETCPGSPSRAQYLPGQPRDTRGYPYLPEYERPIREAFGQMQGGHAVVGITETCERLGDFFGPDAHDQAAEFIGTLEGHEDGRYYLDVMSDEEE